jgi:hypothetical protein
VVKVHEVGLNLDWRWETDSEVSAKDQRCVTDPMCKGIEEFLGKTVVLGFGIG